MFDLFKNDKNELDEIEMGLKSIQIQKSALLSRLGISEEHIADLENQGDFSDEIWEKIQKEKRKIQEELDAALASITKPKA